MSAIWLVKKLTHVWCNSFVWRSVLKSYNLEIQWNWSNHVAIQIIYVSTIIIEYFIATYWLSVHILSSFYFEVSIKENSYTIIKLIKGSQVGTFSP